MLGVGVTNATEEEILEYIIKGLEKKGESYFIVTPNPEILVYANKHKVFKSILNDARLACPDGIGVIWAGKILGKKFKQKVTGVDLLEKLCKRCAEKPITVGFLGGGPKIAEKTAECLREKYTGLKVIFTGSEWPSVRGPAALSIDILFVAYGFPKQEEWMSKHIGKVPVKVMMGVGGAFDYISGTLPRASGTLRVLGFEWLFRLIRQPWRAKRQLALIEFILLILQKKLALRKEDASVL